MSFFLIKAPPARGKGMLFREAKAPEKLFLKNYKKGIDISFSLCYNINRHGRWCGSMAEQLICNQQVVGSTPITSSRGNSRAAKGGRL